MSCLTCKLFSRSFSLACIYALELYSSEPRVLHWDSIQLDDKLTFVEESISIF